VNEGDQILVKVLALEGNKSSSGRRAILKEHAIAEGRRRLSLILLPSSARTFHQDLVALVQLMRTA